MNRPFPAFAALLALLALAMFAVSSSSRSTTVQPPSSRRKAAIEKPVRGQSNFVIVVPAPDEEAREHAARDLTATQLVSVVCVTAPSFDFEFECPAPPALVPATISAADAVPGTGPQLPPVDCRSHYDPIYDDIVYGSVSDSPQATQVEGQRPLSALEVVAIFRDLNAAENSQTPAAALWQWITRALSSHGSSYQAALQSWIRYCLDACVHDLRLTRHFAEAGRPALAWTEYSEIMDEVQPQYAMSEPAPAATVRFGDWLWRSAASYWNRAAGLLFSAAEYPQPALAKSAQGR